jgi:phage-related protein
MLLSDYDSLVATTDSDCYTYYVNWTAERFSDIREKNMEFGSHYRQRLTRGINTENWHKIRTYISKFKEKWERAPEKYQGEWIP